jgi:hypothetical protein
MILFGAGRRKRRGRLNQYGIITTYAQAKLQKNTINLQGEDQAILAQEDILSLDLP